MFAILKRKRVGVFNHADEKKKIVVGTHAAKRWLDRVGSDIPLAEAKEIIAEGIENNGKLVMTNVHKVDGFTRYMEWNGLVFPLINSKNFKTGEIVWLAKTTLLKGMVGS